MADADDDEQELVAYMRQLMDMEKAGERTTIVLGPFGAMALIGFLQLGTRHPYIDAPLKNVARDIVQQLQPLFAGTLGEEIIRRGGHPEFDK